MYSLSTLRKPEPSLQPSDFLDDVLKGLARTPRYVPPRWFYDTRGSELFELITQLPEYYPTRAEREILLSQMDDIVRVIGRNRAVVEYGSGSSAKTISVLQQTHASAYVPIDISGEFLRRSVAELKKQVVGVPMLPLEADFFRPVVLPKLPDDRPRLGFFPGSTLGNASEAEAVDLLRRMSDTLGHGAMLLIGMDRFKDKQILVPAYDDTSGVTAQFNLNLLRRMRSELGAELDIDAFGHQIRWDEERSRIEMHLDAKTATAIRIADREFHFNAGDTIHTENSYKWRSGEARFLLRAGGWAPIAEWTDSKRLFSVYAATRIADEVT
jgi:dimethylhistidine N-methyltransferase